MTQKHPQIIMNTNGNFFFYLAVQHIISTTFTLCKPKPIAFI